MDGLNEAAIRAVVAMIELNPTRWYQGTFWSQRRGDTAHCFASWAVKLAGRDLLGLLKADSTGRLVYVEAQRLLGLTDDQARRLFEWGKDDGGRPHPSVSGLKAKIRAVTGITFKAEP